MYYNSIEEFLTVHEADLIALMERVQAQVGGHYAAMTVDELHASAVSDMQYAISVWRTPQVIRSEARAIAEQTDQAGVDLDDLTRLVDGLQAALLDFVAGCLAEQSDLAGKLLRQIRHSSNNYRSGVTEVKLDKTLRRIGLT